MSLPDLEIANAIPVAAWGACWGATGGYGTGTAIDVTGNGHDATLAGDLTTDSWLDEGAGQFAMESEVGGASYLTLTAIPLTDFSFSIWVKQYNLTGGVILGTLSPYAWVRFQFDCQVRFDGVNRETDSWNGDYGNWKQVVVTRNSTSGLVTVIDRGVVVASVTAETDSFSPDRILSYGNGNNDFEGCWDDLRLFDSVLTLEQAQALYAGNNGRGIVAPVPGFNPYINPHYRV